MKGIILAGGSGTRLYPTTLMLSKQLLPIYDKPMIYYPFSVLMLAQIREVLIISTPKDTPRFQEIFGNGDWLGMEIQYCVQPSPDGLAQGLILAENFVKDENLALILGDNVFYGQGFSLMLLEAKEEANKGKATIFSYRVKDPERFGVVEMDANGAVVSLEEKPCKPKSNLAATGLYFYDKNVCEYAKQIKPSARGELEITDLNKIYLEKGNLDVITLGRGYAWLDTGTMDALSEATEFIKVIENRQGIQISAIEEIAYKNNWINKEQLMEHAKKYGKSPYGEHLKKVADGKIKY